MKNKQAFTLIELLVVVLIIGILAAVAVPQYRKAVEKTRATEALIILKAIANANKVYYLANGEYATDIEALDVEMPGEIESWTNEGYRRKTRWFEYGTQGTGNPATIAVAHRLPGLPYYFNYFHADDVICCYGSTQEGLNVCKTLSNGRSNPDHKQNNSTCYEIP